MARKLRIQFPGAIYHLMSRGDRREDIFRDDIDRESFVETLGDACAKTGWIVHAFVLMPNHFHLVVETPQPNLVAGMKWFLGTYTARFNRRHKLTGHVFAGRYKSLLVGGEGGYLRTVCDYVHLNPVRARLVPTEQPVASYRWSSLPWMVSEPEKRPSWLRVDRLFGECGIRRDNVAGRAEYEQRLESRRAGDSGEDYKAVRSGWCFGGDEFKEELLARVEGGAGQHHFGKELIEAAEAKATRIVDEELRRAVWAEAELERRRKGDPVKLQIARRLRAETTMTMQWIAARLRMGTKSHLSHLLYWDNRGNMEGTEPARAKLSARRRVLGVRGTSTPAAQQMPKGREKKETTTKPTVSQVEVVTQNSALPLTDPSVGGFDTSFD